MGIQVLSEYENALKKIEPPAADETFTIGPLGWCLRAGRRRGLGLRAAGFLNFASLHRYISPPLDFSNPFSAGSSSRLDRGLQRKNKCPQQIRFRAPQGIFIRNFSGALQAQFGGSKTFFGQYLERCGFCSMSASAYRKQLLYSCRLKHLWTNVTEPRSGCLRISRTSMTSVCT